MVNRRDLNPDASPQAAFGARIRRSREEAGWRQEDLAAHTQSSSGHISSCETGRKIPSLPLVRKLDRAFGTGDSPRSFEREWHAIRHGALLEGLHDYVEHEGRASEIRLFDVGIIPGLLQVAEYVTCIEEDGVARGAVTQAQAAERVELVLARQRAIDRPVPPMVLVVLDETCIYRPIGGPKVMRAQLDHLMAFAALPNTILQVAPLSIGQRRPFNRLVHLLTLPTGLVVSYVEAQTHGSVDREAAAVQPLMRAYHQLQAVSLSQAASVDMIQKAREDIT